MSINLSKKNALGRVFWTLPRELREDIFMEAKRIQTIENRHTFRQYFFINSQSNPERIDSQLKKYMIKKCSKFEGCFVANKNVHIALERLAEAA